MKVPQFTWAFELFLSLIFTHKTTTNILHLFWGLCANISVEYTHRVGFLCHTLLILFSKYCIKTFSTLLPVPEFRLRYFLLRTGKWYQNSIFLPLFITLVHFSRSIHIKYLFTMSSSAWKFYTEFLFTE